MKGEESLQITVESPSSRARVSENGSEANSRAIFCRDGENFLPGSSFDTMFTEPLTSESLATMTDMLENLLDRLNEASLPENFDKVRMETLAVVAQNVYLAAFTEKRDLGGGAGSPIQKRRETDRIMNGNGETLLAIRANPMSEEATARRRNSVRRSSFSRHSPGAIVPMIKDQVLNKKFRPSLVPPDIKRGKMGMALVHTPGHFLVLRPRVETVRLYDSWIIWDSLAKYRLVFLFVNTIFVISFLFFAVGGLTMPFYLPLAIMRYSGTTALLLNPDIFSINGTYTVDERGIIGPEGGLGEWEPPWGWSYDDVALVWHDLVAFFIGWFFLLCMFQWNLAMLKLIYLQAKARVVAVFGLSLAYGLAIVTLYPNRSHIMFVTTRTLVVSALCGADARLVSHRLRFTREVFEKRFGGFQGDGKRKKRGPFTIVVAINGLFFAVSDIMRHYVIMFCAEEQYLINFDVRNPVTGNHMSVSNLMLAESCYFTSMLFVVHIVFNMNSTFQGAETTIAACRFDFSST